MSIIAEQRGGSTAATMATEGTRQATAALDAEPDTWTRDSRVHALAQAERAAEAEQAAYGIEPEAGA